MTNWYWVVSHSFCCGAYTDDSKIIVKTAPILEKFVGQPLENLYNWKPVRKICALGNKINEGDEPHQEWTPYYEPVGII